MSHKPNPILLDLSRQLPASAKTSTLIKETRDYEGIAEQAQKDRSSLKAIDLANEDDSAIKAQLNEIGYAPIWECEDIDEERTRIVGALLLIIELAEELAED